MDVAPYIGSVIERTLIDDRLIEKVVARVVCIDIGVDDGIFVDGEHQAVGSLGAGELLEVEFELFRLSLQIDGLAQKPALSGLQPYLAK